jgi:hypothetical protein
MIERRRRLGAAVAVTVLLVLGAGCSESKFDQATGKGWIRGINSIVDSPELFFVIAEQAEGGVNFRATQGFNEWDDLSYNFSFDLFRQGQDEPDRLVTQLVDVEPDIEYSLALIGSLDEPELLMWEVPEREWDGTEAIFEVDFVHLSPQTGQLDVYYAPEGTAPVPGNEIGTLSYGERLPYREFDQGDYVLVLTAPGDPATVILESAPIAVNPAERITVAFFDPDSTITSAVGVNIITRDGTAVPLGDVNALPKARMLHAAFGTTAFDGYINNDLSAAAFPDVEFGELTPYVDMTELEAPLTITSAGDPDTVLLEDTIQSVTDTLRTVVFFGPADAWLTRTLADSSRPIATSPQFRISNFSANIAAVDVFDVATGSTPEEVVLPRFFNLQSGSSTNFSFGFLEPRDLIVTLPGETEPVAAPLTLDLVGGQLLEIMVVDTVDPAVVELVIFESRP